MQGIAIPSDEPFSVVFADLMPHLVELHWLLDLQAGPFVITDKPDFEALDARLESLWVEDPRLEKISGGLWRPGTLTTLAEMILHDEQGYFFGLSPDLEIAIDAALELERTPRDQRLLSAVARHARIFAFFGFESWEVFSADPELGKYLRQLPRARQLPPQASQFFVG